MGWSRTRRQCHSSNFDVSHPVSRLSVALSSERCSCRNKHCQSSRRECRMPDSARVVWLNSWMAVARYALLGPESRVMIGEKRTSLG